MKEEQHIEETAPLLDSPLPRRFTVDDALNEIGLGRFQYLMLCILGFTWVADLSEIILLAFLAPAVYCVSLMFWNLYLVSCLGEM